ncbi:MAG: fibronectin type III domain-containing protein [Spirochaetales bacterium]|nr:fibronectin type III domain-containing protein [Spirochaetales bacterium]
MKIRFRVIMAALLVVAGGPLFARDRTIALGGGEQWAAFPKIEGLTALPGRGGFADLCLADSEYPVGPSTDLLLHFNSPPLREETGHYSITSSSAGVNEKYAKFGKGAGVFSGNGGIVLEPLSGALFGPGSVWTDFSIEFWLYPAALADGEVVFAWKGYRRYGGKLIPQTLECRVRRRTLVWTFENLFTPATGEPFRFELESVESLIPRRWRHHLLRFNNREGILEYLVDDVPAGTRYTTVSGLESSQACVPLIGEAEHSSLSVAPRFTGFMDELRVSAEYVKTPLLHRYSEARGRATSRVFDLGSTGTVVKRVNALLDQPGDTEIDFYIRASDSFDTFERLKGDWRPFVPGKSFGNGLTGRYVQLMVEFFPDGGNEVSPRLFSIDIVYEPALAPPSPADLRAVAGDGKVTLSWKPVVEDDVKGYFVFYGEAPLNYLGEGAAEGKSPIDVGNVTTFELSGLTNGKLYFFAVAAYDTATPAHLSEFHEEKSARPSEVKK